MQLENNLMRPGSPKDRWEDLLTLFQGTHFAQNDVKGPFARQGQSSKAFGGPIDTVEIYETVCWRNKWERWFESENEEKSQGYVK
jgi:hypothetical protein